MDPPVVDSLVAKDIHLHPNGHHTSDSSDSNSDEVQLAERGIAIKPENVGKPQVDEEYVTGFKLALVLGCITLVYFLMMLDVTILATAIPYITNDFHSLLDVGWYASAYSLANASLQPLTGRIYMRLNSKKAFLVFLFVFELGSLLCGVATSSKMLIVGRAVAGLGGSGLMNGALTIFNSCIPPHRQPALLGILMALGMLGIAFGPLLGGAITEYATWRWCFYINLPVGGPVALVFLLLRIPDKIAKPDWRIVARNLLSEFDLIGFAIFAPASIMFFLALQYGGNQFAWNSPTVICLFWGAGVTFIIWLGWNYWKGDDAMIPVSILSNRGVWSSCSQNLFFAGTIFVTAYYLPIYFQVVLGKKPLISGVDVLANILPQMFTTIIAGRMVQIFGYYLPFTLSGGVLNAIACGILSLLSPTTSVGKWVGYQMLLGVSRGLAISMPILVIQSTLPAPQVPIGMCLFVFSQMFGGAIMVVFSQTILTNSLKTELPKYAPAVNAQAVIAAGATNFRKVVPPNLLEGVLVAYAKSLGRIYYLAAPMAVVALVLSYFMGWRDLRKKEVGNEEEMEERGKEGDGDGDGDARDTATTTTKAGGQESMEMSRRSLDREAVSRDQSGLQGVQIHHALDLDGF